MGFCHGPGVLERSGPTWGVLDFSGLFWIVLGRPAAGRSGKSWGALVLVRPGAVLGRPDLTLQNAVCAAYRVCADAHLGVLGRPGAFWGALERPEASWGVPKRSGTVLRRPGAFFGILGYVHPKRPQMYYFQLILLLLWFPRGPGEHATPAAAYGWNAGCRALQVTSLCLCL